MAVMEMVDIINEQDEVLETVTRKEMRQKQLPHRATYVAILDDASRVLVEVRTLTKDYAPGLFDACVGGVVQSGEDIEHSARREVFEEVGGDIEKDNLEFHNLGKLIIHHDDFRGFTMAYLYLAKGSFISKRQASEVSGIMLLAPSELDKLKDACVGDSFIAYQEIMKRARDKGII